MVSAIFPFRISVFLLPPSQKPPAVSCWSASAAHNTTSGRVLTLSKKHGNERNETRLPVVIRSVPLYKKRVWVHAESWSSPAASARTVHFAHIMTPTRCCTQIRVHIHLRWCPSTSTVCCLFPFGRAVRPSQIIKRGAALIFPVPRYTVFLVFFSGCTESIRFP